MNPHKHSIVPGLLMILLGLWLLKTQYSVLDQLWTQYYYYGFLIFAALMFIDALALQNKQSVFWGVTALIAGSFYALRDNALCFDGGSASWPIWILAVGIGFFVLFFLCPSKWGLLILSGILMLAAFRFMIEHVFYAEQNWFELIRIYWPAIVIVIGLAVLFSGFLNNNKMSQLPDDK